MVSDGVMKLSLQQGNLDDPSLSRIRAMLRRSHEEGEALLRAPDAGSTLRLHTLAVAAEHGLEGYSIYKGAVGEDEVLEALRTMQPDSLKAFAAEISYIAKYSHFEPVRLLAAFCLEE